MNRAFILTIFPRMAVLVGGALLWSLSAWAAYVETIQLTGDGAEEVPGKFLSFTPVTGTVENIEVVEEEEDEGGGIFIKLTLSDDATTQGDLTIGSGDEGQVFGLPAIGAGQTLGLDVGTGAVSVSDIPGFNPSTIPLDAELPSWGVHLGTAYREVDVPSVGFGLRISGGNELFVVETAPDVDGQSIVGGITYTAPGFGGVSFTAEYFEDDQDYLGGVAEGTDVTGNVNLDFNPNDNTTGILYGASGLDVQVQNDVEYWRLGGSYFPSDRWQLDGGIRWSPKIEFTHLEQTTSGISQPLAIAGISDTRLINLEGNYLDIGVDVFRPFYLNENFKWWPRAEFGVQHANMKLDGRQDFVCAPCGTGANFQLDVNSEDDLFTWTAGLGAGAAFMFDTNGSGKKDIMLYADAGWRTRGDALEGFIPFTGDNLFVEGRAAEITDGGSFDETSFKIGILASF